MSKRVIYDGWGIFCDGGGFHAGVMDLGRDSKQLVV